MHTKSCLTAKNARAAVLQVIRQKQSELSGEILTQKFKLRRKLEAELGIPKLEKEVNRLHKMITKKVEAAMKVVYRQNKKTEDYMCELRTRALFASTGELREIFEELGK